MTPRYDETNTIELTYAHCEDCKANDIMIRLRRYCLCHPDADCDTYSCDTGTEFCLLCQARRDLAVALSKLKEQEAEMCAIADKYTDLDLELELFRSAALSAKEDSP